MGNYVERLLYVALVLIFIGVSIAFYVLANLIHNESRQIKTLQTILDNQQQTTQQIKALSQDQKQGVDNLQKDMECLGMFFSLPNRANVVINDLKTCSITDTSSGANSNLPLKSTSTISSPSPSPTASPTLVKHEPTLGERISGIIKALGL